MVSASSTIGCENVRNGGNHAAVGELAKATGGEVFAVAGDLTNEMAFGLTIAEQTVNLEACANAEAARIADAFGAR